MNDGVFKRIGSVVRNYVDTAIAGLRADLQAQIAAIQAPAPVYNVVANNVSNVGITANGTKVVDSYLASANRSARLTMQIVDTVNGEVQLQENLVTHDAVNAYDVIVGQMITGTTELVTLVTAFDGTTVTVSLTNQTGHLLEVKVSTELL